MTEGKQGRMLILTNEHVGKGEQTTVCRGRDHMALSPGCVLDVCTAGDRAVAFARARVLKVEVVPLADVSDHTLQREHDPSRRDLRGLLRSLGAEYPDLTVTENVTVVWFRFESADSE